MPKLGESYRKKGSYVDPYMSFRFKILIDGIIEGGFTEVSGLQATTQVEDFIEGGVNTYVRKLPKETTFENLVLKKGLADSKNRKFNRFNLVPCRCRSFNHHRDFCHLRYKLFLIHQFCQHLARISNKHELASANDGGSCPLMVVGQHSRPLIPSVICQRRPR